MLIERHGFGEMCIVVSVKWVLLSLLQSTMLLGGVVFSEIDSGSFFFPAFE